MTALELRWPGGVGRWAVLAAGLAWVGALAGYHAGIAPVVAIAAVGVAVGRTSGRAAGVSVVVVAAAVSGALAAHRMERTLEAPAPAGRVELVGVVLEDPRPYGESFRLVLQPQALLVTEQWKPFSGAPLAVVADERFPVAGGTVRVSGVGRPGPELVRGDPVAGVIYADALARVAAPTNPLFVAGNALRSRVSAGLASHRSDSAAPLLAGFLIGDTTALDPADTEALRRAGLTHYVAVSGSNVALFLAAWWLVAAPFAWNPRLRARRWGWWVSPCSLS